MHYFTLNQSYIFAFSVYGGLMIALVYDFFRFVRYVFRAGRIFTAISDLLFWLCAAAIGGFVLFLSSSGRIRLFPFIGYLLGFCIYRTGISGLFWRIVSFFQNKWKKPLSK